MPRTVSLFSSELPEFVIFESAEPERLTIAAVRVPTSAVLGVAIQPPIA
jgi:hypothetical protein